ncbi:MAG: hypothetical protein Q8M76_03445, partial [Spirochaetaceae bacterium]|nr:hypothetical protein [Spirochaetaceae bacterium]
AYEKHLLTEDLQSALLERQNLENDLRTQVENARLVKMKLEQCLDEYEEREKATRLEIQQIQEQLLTREREIERLLEIRIKKALRGILRRVRLLAATILSHRGEK